MKIVLALVLIASAAFAAEIGLGVRTYYGAQVLRVTAKSPEQFEALKNLHDSSKFDFWTTPALNHGTDIMAEAEQLEELHAFLHEHSIEHSVMIKDVQQIVSEEKIANNLHQSRAMGWTAYQRFDTISSWLDELAANNSDLVTCETIGHSFEGRPLKLVKISNGGNSTKRTIFIDGTFHAREWISGATATFLINELVENSEEHSDLLDSLDFYILPVTNPDGYEYTHTNVRTWRKTRSDHNSTQNCRGVDPNRNFGYHYGESGTSTDKCSDTYRGPNAFSEPETKALADFILETADSANYAAYLTLHSYSQLWLVPWGYAAVYPPDWDALEALAIAGATALRGVHGSRYDVEHSAIGLYPAAGASDDWAKGGAGIDFAYTLELRDTGRYGFLLPPDQIVPTGEEVWAAVETVARHFITESE